MEERLPAGILALHVGGGVLLGVAVGLGPLQGLVEGHTVLDHAGEDIVCCSVEDAADLQNVVGRHAVAQGPQDGDAPAHAGLKEIDRAVLCRQGEQPGAMSRHQLLVGGDHTLACLQGPLGKVQGSAHAADGLHHHLDLRVVLNDGEVLDEAAGEGAVRELPHVQNIFQVDQFICLFVHAGALAGEDFCHTGANYAKA